MPRPSAYGRCWYCGSLFNLKSVEPERTIALLAGRKIPHKCCSWCIANNPMRVRMDPTRRKVAYNFSLRHVE